MLETSSRCSVKNQCWKDPDAPSAKYIVGAGEKAIEISTDDPVFAVAAGEGESVVQVTFGFVAVETKAAPEPVIVGPDQQAVVSAVEPTPRVDTQLEKASTV
jgi:ferric-dicitrate binding protein FerR (iron transport regulator)